MLKRVLAIWIPIAIGAGACSLANSPDDPIDPAAGGAGGSSVTGGAGGATECTSDAECDDADPCTVDACNAQGTCEIASTTDPNDDNACTDDSCDPTTAAAVNAPVVVMDDGDMCTIDICIPAYGTFNALEAPVFIEDFANNDAGWTMTNGSQWEIGPAAVSGLSQTLGRITDPAEDHTPSADNGLAGVNIGGFLDTTTAGSVYYLEGPEFDATISGTEFLALTYWRSLGSDYPPFMDHTVEVWDGSAWQEVFAVPTNTTVADTAWKRVMHNITAYANPAMKVRFKYAVLQGGVFEDAPSWSIDDIAVVKSVVQLTDDNLCTSFSCDPTTGTLTSVGLDADDNDPCTQDTCGAVQGIDHRDLIVQRHIDFSTNTFPLDSNPKPPALGGWQRGAAIGAPTVGDPADDTSPSADMMLAGVNIGGPYGTTSGESGLFSVGLGFLNNDGLTNLSWKQLVWAGPNAETPHRVRLFRNNVLVQTLFTNSSLPLENNGWTTQDFDLTNIITSSGSGSYRLEFFYEILQSTTARGGFSIDDIILTNDSCMLPVMAN